MVEHKDSTDVVVVTFRDADATVRDLAAALSLNVTDVLAIDGVPYDSALKLSEVGIANGSVVSMAETLRSGRNEGRFWLGVVNGPETGLLVQVDPGETISIGRSPDNDLAIDNTTVSQQHARLHLSEVGSIELEDLGSRNGTWLGGHAVTGSTPIEPGQLLRLGSSMLRIDEIDPTERIVGMSTGHADHTGRVLLNRPPRPPMPSGPATIALPAAIEDRSGPTLAIVTLLAPLIFAGVMVVALGSWRYAIFGLLSPVMALGNWLSGRRRVGRERKSDGQRHADAIERLQGDLERAERLERQRRQVLGPDIIEVRRRIALPTRQLWERRLRNPDALTVRLGVGESPWELDTEMTPESAEVIEILDRTATLDEIEVLVDLRDGPVGLVGEPETATAAVRNLLLQLATHHGPADVRIAVLTAPDRLEEWSWVQWLPHCTSGDGSTHLLVGDGAADFASAVAKATESQHDRHDSVAWVLVVDDLELIHGRSSPLRHTLATGAAIGLVIAPTEDALPASVTNVVRVQDSDGVFSLTKPSTPAIGSSGVLGLVSGGIAGELARSLSRFEDPEEIQIGGSLPRFVSAGDLFGAHLDAPAVKKRWIANNDDRALETAVGVAADGRFDIDLVADGPHALIAGTTGSGKSELLRTLVVGLASNYAPSHVVFVLIDYKGGSAFDRCAALPHVVGVVTDLDEHLSERALQSLEAELRYREEQLRVAGAENIDAYRSAGEQRASIPRLIVMIDEFATLRNELPGFVDSLVAIAQRGRSLGMHLVLATQRPSGSVDANIRANANLRIALRVQSSADSTDVIDAASAANISRTLPGRAFVRRGQGDLVAVQTGFVSGDVGSSGPPVVARRPTFGSGGVFEVDQVGDSTDAAASSVSEGSERTPSELEGLVAAVVEAGAGLPEVRRPWLDELPLAVLPHDLASACDFADEDGPVVLAIGDDPANQRRVKRCWDPEDGHLAAIGIRGSGVTTAIRSAVAALGVSELGRDVWVFAVDHAGGGLSDIDEWPHVACCLGTTERARHLRLLSFLDSELERRRRRAPNDLDPIPLLVVAIDGVAAFMETIDAEPGTPSGDIMARLGRDGPSVGIALIVGAERFGDVPRALRGQLRRNLLFEQADVNDFAAAGLRPKTLPRFAPGRAVLSTDGMLCQVVDWAAGLRPNQIVLDRPPPVIETLETRIESARLTAASVEPTLRIPIGVLETTRTQAVLSLRRGEHATVAGPSGSGRTNALRLIAAQLRHASPDLVIVGVTSEGDSSLLDSPVLDAGGSLTEIEHVLRMATDDDRRWMILVDDAERIEVEHGPLVDLARAAPTHVTMIVAIRSSSGRGAYGHWTRAARASGIGLLLMPDVSLDGELLGARLPRTDHLEAVPGRGYLVAAGRADVMQLAHV